MAICIWGMSTTVGNLQQAMPTLFGGEKGLLVQGEVPKELRTDSLLSWQPQRAMADCIARSILRQSGSLRSCLLSSFKTSASSAAGRG
jgi:hypothetical protein